MLRKLCVPVWEYYDGFGADAASREPARPDDVVFGERGPNRRREFEPFAVQLESSGSLIVEECRAVCNSTLVQPDYVFSRRKSIRGHFSRARPVAGPLESVFERTDNAVGSARAKLVFPAIHPASVAVGHWFQKRFHECDRGIRSGISSIIAKCPLRFTNFQCIERSMAAIKPIWPVTRRWISAATPFE